MGLIRIRTLVGVGVGLGVSAGMAAGVGVVAAHSTSGSGTTPPAIPVVSHVRLSPPKFRAALTPTAGHGATVHYQLNENNSVQTFVVKKKSGAHWITLKGTFMKKGRQGADVFPFPGVVHGHKLLKGQYELVVTPHVAGVGTGKTVTAHFSVIS